MSASSRFRRLQTVLRLGAAHGRRSVSISLLGARRLFPGPLFPRLSLFPSFPGLRPLAVLYRFAVDAALWLERERESWFLWIPVLFGVGIALYFHLKHEPGLWFAALFLVIAAALALLLRRVPLLSTGALALFIAACGFSAAKIRTEWVRAPVLAAPTGPVTLSGTIERAEALQQGVIRFILSAPDIEGLGHTGLVRVRVTVHQGGAGFIPGERLRVRAKLWPPSPPSLPGGYDFARAAWYQQLGGTGYALSLPERLPALPPSGLLSGAGTAMEQLREAIGARVSKTLPGQTGAIARALITGERGGIPEETNAAYKAAGLYHILSISGLHMAIMAGSVFYFVRLLLALIPTLALRFPIKKWAALAAIAGAFAYLHLSGGSIPALRSALMISILFAAILLDRPAIALRNVALAALFILALWPENLLDPGFQMSFAAVAALVAAHEALHQALHGGQGRRGGRQLTPLARSALFFAEIVFSTLVASAAVAPFGIYHFQQVQLLAAAANLGAVPVCNFIVMPAALATLILMPFGLDSLPLWIMGEGIRAMTWCAHQVAALPGATAHTPPMAPAALALLAGGGLWLVLWRTRLRLVGLAAMAGALFVPAVEKPDILVSGRGLAALRGPDGRLAALVSGWAQSSQAAFELTQWLARDGDGRSPAEAFAASPFRCDGVGCTLLVKGNMVAVSLSPAATVDDCARAAIVLIPGGRAPQGCEARAVIDGPALRESGVHAIYIGAGGELRISRTLDPSGGRPWTAGFAAERRPQKAAPVHPLFGTN